MSDTKGSVTASAAKSARAAGSPSVCLVLGGARSGKSAVAEGQVLASGLEPVYLATAEARDGEMAERIARHRTRRGQVWKTIEEPLELIDVLIAQAGPERIILVDCLTLWLANLMGAERDPVAEGDRLAVALADAAGPIVLVSNEVGQGIVPDNALARRFRDEAGLIHLKVAAVSGRVLFVTAGIAQTLKDVR
jgi:adenosylcobinamide kinase / adenosylcobinamide-phosphate guanylyltransferase